MTKLSSGQPSVHSSNCHSEKRWECRQRPLHASFSFQIREKTQARTSSFSSTENKIVYPQRKPRRLQQGLTRMTWQERNDLGYHWDWTTELFLLSLHSIPPKWKHLASDQLLLIQNSSTWLSICRREYNCGFETCRHSWQGGIAGHYWEAPYATESELIQILFSLNLLMHRKLAFVCETLHWLPLRQLSHFLPTFSRWYFLINYLY